MRVHYDSVRFQLAVAISMSIGLVNDQRLVPIKIERIGGTACGYE